jgi:hypothetical protein
VRALAIALVLAVPATAFADDDDADASEANLETKAPRSGVTLSAAFGPSFGVGFGIDGSVGTGGALTLRLGHVMTPRSVLTLELVGASQLHQAAMQGATLHNDDLRLLVGAQYYAQPSLWVRFGGGYGSYHEDFGGDKGDRTLRGVAGLLGFGLDLARFGHWVIGSEFFTSGTITKDGLMTSQALCLGVSRY